MCITLVSDLQLILSFEIVSGDLKNHQAFIMHHSLSHLHLMHNSCRLIFIAVESETLLDDVGILWIYNLSGHETESFQLAIAE